MLVSFLNLSVVFFSLSPPRYPPLPCDVSIQLVFIIFLLFMIIQCWYSSSISTSSTCSFDGQRTLASPLFCGPHTPWTLPLPCHICIFSVILGLCAGACISRAVTLAPTLFGWRKTRDFQGTLSNCSFHFPVRTMFLDFYSTCISACRTCMKFKSTFICSENDGRTWSVTF